MRAAGIYEGRDALHGTEGDIDAREGAVDLPGIMESLIETGSVWFETTHVTREGDRIPVEISSRLFPPKRDRTLVLSIARDISRRKQAEEGLRRSEERYRNIFENAVEGIYQVTPEGSYLSVNPALARIHEFDSPEEMIASVTDIAHQLYVDPSRRARLKQLVEEEGSVRNFEIMMRRKDGSLHWVSNTAHAVRDDTGRLVDHEGTVEDITTRKFAEEELRELKSTLGGMLDMVSRITEARDPGIKGHQERVSRLARAIATEMGFSAEMADNIEKEALIHDVGMISVPAEILMRPGPLTEMEQNLRKVDPRAGYELVKKQACPIRSRRSFSSTTSAWRWSRLSPRPQGERDTPRSTHPRGGRRGRGRGRGPSLQARSRYSQRAQGDRRRTGNSLRPRGSPRLPHALQEKGIFFGP